MSLRNREMLSDSGHDSKMVTAMEMNSSGPGVAADDHDDDDDDRKKKAAPAAGGGGVGLEDRMSMAILLLLYTLQGIPMGLSGSIPLIMKERGVTYEGLSLFSLVSVPFSLKLFWAPLVDSMYFKSVGRRKTWLIPVQILTGVVMLVAAPYVDAWMGHPLDGTGTGGGDVGGGGEEDAAGPQVAVLTGFFLFLYFLMATQDIVVDGWALTMLSRENVGYASICNSIGQSFGFFLANQGFIALSDATWCHRYLGTEEGQSVATLSGFMTICGWVFVILTVLITVFKTERPDETGEVPEGLVETYQHVIAIFRLKPVQKLTMLLLTVRIAFAPNDAVSGFKLQEYGMPKADIAMISPLLLVIGLVLPAVVSDAVSKRPLDIFMLGLPLKLVGSFLGWLAVQTAYRAYQDDHGVPGGAHPGWWFFAPLVVIMVLNEIAGSLIFASVMSFFAKISDPAIGGTYMTLLNTVTNLGAKWPNATALYFLPKLTFAQCVAKGDKDPSAGLLKKLAKVSCAHSTAACSAAGGHCNILLDGFTIETAVCLVVGVVWVLMCRDTVARLQYQPFSDWMVIGKDRDSRKE